jgi:hypothetical protein
MALQFNRCYRNETDGTCKQPPGDARCDTKTTGEKTMEVNLRHLRNLIRTRKDEIEQSVEGTGYLARTVIGVGTFLLDNEGDLDLLTSKQMAIFERFLKPLLERPPR